MVGPRGRAIVKEAEGLRLVAYLCPSGKPTLGWGHTKGVRLGDRCTVEQAEQWLAEDLAEAEAALDRFVVAPLTEGMRDALASWTFNLGAGKLRISTLLRRLNLRHYGDVPGEMKRWVWAKDKDTGELVELAGLKTRREREAALFLADGIPEGGG